ncbi:MAG: NAD(P)-binding protein [Gammaproteobacteria bacterium]|nr:NAD(P)-binding protein [Gammaproteobacteria bacterium]
MDSRDRRLGMDRAISRRDFMSGVSIAVGAALLPACSRSGAPPADGPVAHYPPASTDMRGSHAGSFEAAHTTVQGRQWMPEKTAEHYDLVIVGAGISGLSAAYMYRRDVDTNARILILDNHDDFGGHAKRNEFELDGETYIGYGGTMLMEAPATYPAIARQLVQELGIDVDRHGEFFHANLFGSSGGRHSFFDKETFGADFLANGAQGIEDSIDEAPLSESAKAELKRLFDDTEDYLAGMTPAERRAVLETHSWHDYLHKYAGMGEEVLTFVHKWSHGVWAIGADALPAWMAWGEGYPGFAGMDLGSSDDSGEEDPRRFYFPDGNASIARLLVRKLVPEVAPGDSMEDVVTARFDYSKLDVPESPTRIRLNSTVVGLSHQNGKLDAEVDVIYANADKARTVVARKVIWAGYHAMLPHICPDLPDEQIVALGNSVRAPLVYTNVLIRNWRSLDKLSMRRAYCPGSFFQTVMMTHPVSIGDYQFSESPDEPVILHMQHIPLSPGLPAADQFRAGRQALLELPFETFERNVRDQLGRLLGPGGFDSGRDIAGITVNRWPHGYAYSVDAESGDVSWWPESWKHERRPWVDARQRVGNIAFAGTDASSNAMTESAIEEAHRAISSFATEGA